jgi:endonuclease VIII
MPEGPSILHLKDQLQVFKGRQVKKAGGYGNMPTKWIDGRQLKNIETWGKHLLLVFTNGVVRIHLGLFGDILINKRKKVNRSFFLTFANGEINGYVVKATKITEPLEEIYDWRTDILSVQFDKPHIKNLLKQKVAKTIDDVLMDQKVFTGVGNKIRNEALYRAGIHPQSIIGKIPPAKITRLINEVVNYAKIFYRQLKTKGVNDNFQVYQQDYAADGSKVTVQVLQKSKRKIYFSEHRQQLYV